MDGQIIITLPTGTWLFVKVPKNSLYFELFDNNKGVHWVMQYGYSCPIRFDFEVEIFSLASAMTEELAAQMVESTRNKEYKDYVADKTSLGKYGSYFMSTALESFATLMAAHGMYTKNPLNKPSVAFMHGRMLDGKYSLTDGFNRDLYDKDMQEWQSYESKVSEYVILKEVK